MKLHIPAGHRLSIFFCRLPNHWHRPPDNRDSPRAFAGDQGGGNQIPRHRANRQIRNFRWLSKAGLIPQVLDDGIDDNYRFELAVTGSGYTVHADAIEIESGEVTSLWTKAA